MNSLNKYLLSGYYAPDSIQGTGHTPRTIQTPQIPHFGPEAGKRGNMRMADKCNAKKVELGNRQENKYKLVFSESTDSEGLLGVTDSG